MLVCTPKARMICIYHARMPLRTSAKNGPRVEGRPSLYSGQRLGVQGGLGNRAGQGFAGLAAALGCRRSFPRGEGAPPPAHPPTGARLQSGSWAMATGQGPESSPWEPCYYHVGQPK